MSAAAQVGVQPARHLATGRETARAKRAHASGAAGEHGTAADSPPAQLPLAENGRVNRRAREQAGRAEPGQMDEARHQHPH